MVHVKFDPASVTLSEFEYPVQYGAGDYNYFHGTRPFMRGYGYNQSGAGLGNFLRTLWRAILPGMKSAGKVIGKEASSTSARALEKIAQGDDVKNALATEAAKGIDNLLSLSRTNIGQNPNQYGTGNRIPRKNKKRKNINTRIIGKAIHSSFNPKRKRLDTFGFY